LNPEILDKALDRYDDLHEANVEFYKNLSKEFYKNALADREKINVFKKEFLSHLTFIAELHTDFEPGWIKEKDVILSWDVKRETLKILICRASKDKIEALNNEGTVTNEIRDLLKRYHHYQGKFVFDEFALSF
jgi:hypothetical protein